MIPELYSKNTTQHGIAVLFYSAPSRMYAFMRLDVVTGIIKCSTFKRKSGQWMRLFSPNGSEQLLKAYPCRMLVAASGGVDMWRNMLFNACDMIEEDLRIKVDYQDISGVEAVLNDVAQYPQFAEHAKALRAGSYFAWQYTMMIAAFAGAREYIQRGYMTAAQVAA